MIGILNLSYYLDEQTYKQICEKFGLSKENRKREFYDNPITAITVLDLHYERWGRVYFFDTIIDVNRLYSAEKGSFVPADKIESQGFYKLLKEAYKNTFGQEISEGIFYRERFYCTYIEYFAYINLNNADLLMEELKQGKFNAEQLDINFFELYRLKNAYISFTINQIDKHTVRLCAKCPNTILKKIFKVDGIDEDGNIPHTKISQVLKKEMAAEILYKQVVKHTKPNIPTELSKENILAAL